MAATPVAPAIQSLNSLIGQYTTALAPQSKQISADIAANDASGVAQTQGLDAKKTAAFNDITQGANDRGGYFSGFTPDAEAKYTAGTYLPALAQLQSTIAGTRSTLLGKKADLASSANTAALGEFSNEKNAHLTWEEQIQKEQADAAANANQNKFTAGQNALDRTAANARAAAANANVTPAQQKITDIGAFHGSLGKVAGSDGYVSQTSYAQAKALWAAMGYNTKEFDQQFSSYRNPDNNKYKLG